jgi:arylformamidase
VRVTRLVDLSVPVDAGTQVFPGDPVFASQPHTTVAADGYNVQAVRMGSQTGTHVDAPLHFFDGRPGVDQMPLDLLIGRARVIDLPHRGGISAQHLSEAGLREDLRVLLRTPNSALWNTNDGFHSDYAYITEDGAKFLVDQGVKVVGVDYLSVEQFKKPGAPAHHALLGAGVIIIEGLNLSDAEAGQYEMYCLPLKIKDGDGAPARVVLKR